MPGKPTRGPDRKPRKLKGANEYETRYLNDFEGGFRAGVTIAEYEARQGWPLFTIWPEAEFARGPKDRGRFLYVNATDEERKVLDVVKTRRPAPNKGKRKHI